MIPKFIGEQLKEAEDDLNRCIKDLQDRLTDLRLAWGNQDIESLYDMGFITRGQYKNWLTEIENLKGEEMGEAIQANLEDD